MDQVKDREYFKENTLHMRTAMHPSADDIGITLLSRANLRYFVVEGQGVLYGSYVKKWEMPKKAGQWGYLFKTQRRLYRALEIKEELGVKLRRATSQGTGNNWKFISTA